MSQDPLRAAGLRRTPARLSVLRCFEVVDRAMSHADLRATPELAACDDVTLYRTLHTLEAARLVHVVVGVDGVRRYRANPRDLAGCPGNHAHFACTTCGCTTCLVDQPMPHVRVPAGATVGGRSFVVFGTCAACGGGSAETG